MRRYVQYFIFFCMFSTLSLILHLYIFFHMSYLLGIPRDIWFYLFYFLSSFSYMFSMGLIMRFDNFLVRIINILASVWLGILFLMLIILLGYDILRLFMHIDSEVAGPFIIYSVIILSVAAVLFAKFIRYRKINIPAKNINPGLKIVQLSDVHIGAIHGKRFLKRVVGKTNKLEPDMVLITGDLADGPLRYNKDSFSALNSINAPVFFSLGNHEYYAGLEDILRLLAQTKVRVLRNEMVVEKGIQVIGIDYAWERRTVVQLLKKLQLDKSCFTVLMYHQPRGLEDASKYGVDLMLSGHTHGGQFIPFTFFAKLIWKRYKGLYKHNNTYLYTSTGTGTWGPPFRLGTRSEIVEINLTA
jgi:predicted MPP superfamily phosphohydrolase